MKAEPIAEPLLPDPGAPPTRDLSLKLGVITRQLRKAFDRNIGDIGVTRSQWTVIAVAARVPGATQRTIAEALDMTEAAAGRLIDRLCADGMLERRAKADDRRAHCIHITPAAKPVLEQLAKLGRTNEAAAVAGFSAAELDQLGALLDRVYANLTPPKVP